MRARIITCGVVIALSMTLRAVQTPTLRITWPPPDAIVGDATRIQAEIAPAATPVESVSFSVNGLLVCTVERPPFGCPWNPGAVRPYHIRVVATLANGQSLVANVRTKDLGYTERARADAVLVPVIVTDRGKFVRGLTRQDFEVFEDGVRQPIASLASEESPLDLVMAMDVSGSMENALDDVKVAVKQFLTKLRPGDAATLVGFNDNMFIAAERETDPATREAAVDLLASWGGTAIYDATVRVLDMVGRNAGRRGVVLFSDGDDQNSMTTRETAMARVQSSDAMLYTIGFGGGVTSAAAAEQSRGVRDLHRRPRVLPAPHPGTGRHLRSHRQRAGEPVRALVFPAESRGRQPMARDQRQGAQGEVRRQGQAWVPPAGAGPPRAWR
jgi:Mg-chelatase subunit ChlD